MRLAGRMFESPKLGLIETQMNVKGPSDICRHEALEKFSDFSGKNTTSNSWHKIQYILLQRR